MQLVTLSDVLYPSPQSSSPHLSPSESTEKQRKKRKIAEVKFDADSPPDNSRNLKNRRVKPASTVNPEMKIQLNANRNLAYKYIALDYVNKGRKQEALEALEGISEPLQKNRAAADIALLFSSMGHFEDAQATANKINDDSTKGDVLRKIAVDLSKEGKVQEAENILSQLPNKPLNALARASWQKLPSCEPHKRLPFSQFLDQLQSRHAKTQMTTVEPKPPPVQPKPSFKEIKVKGRELKKLSSHHSWTMPTMNKEWNVQESPAGNINIRVRENDDSSGIKLRSKKVINRAFEEDV